VACEGLAQPVDGGLQPGRLVDTGNGRGLDLLEAAQLGGPGEVSAQRLADLAELDPGGWKMTKGAPLFPREIPGAP